MQQQDLMHCQHRTSSRVSLPAGVTGVQVQQDLARPGVLERFVTSRSDAELLRACFAGVILELSAT